MSPASSIGKHVRLFPLRPVSSVSPVSGDQCRPLLRSAACPSLSLETCFFHLSRLWRPVSPASSIGSMSVSSLETCFFCLSRLWRPVSPRFFDRQHVRLFPLRPVSSFSPVSGDQCHPLLRSAACPSLSLETCFFCLSVSGDQCHPLLRSAACPSLSLETCFFLLSRLWRPVSPASSIGSMSVSILKVLLAVCVP